MAFKSKAPTRCKDCKVFVPVGGGMTQGPPWVTRCMACWPNAPAPTAPATPVLITRKGANAALRPKGFLGPERFAAYRAAIEGAIWNPDSKTNEVSLDKLSVILGRLEKENFKAEVHPEISASLQALESQTKNQIQEASDRIDEILQSRGLSLYPFQKTGVKWLTSKYGAVLADQMGCGKTPEALMAIPYPSPVLIVCPAVAKGVWESHILKWRPDIVPTILYGRDSFRWPKSGEAIIVNYDILPELQTEEDEEGNQTEPFLPFEIEKGILNGTTVIADEAHKLKNFHSQQTMKFRAISELVRKKEGRIWLLTATPLLNYPPELWSVFQAAGIAQEAFGSWKQFVSFFEGIKGAHGGTIWGKPKPEVADRIRRVSLRRMREDVLPDLPVKTYQDVLVDIDGITKQECDKVWETIRSYPDIDIETAIKAAQTSRSSVISIESWSKNRVAVATAKIPTMLAMIEDYEDQEEPVVVFSSHRAPIDILKDRKGWEVITGDTPSNKRSEIEKNFQAGKLKGIGGTIEAAGVAITLTRAAHAIFVDQSPTPALNNQAEDRLVRIGQTRGVIITILKANHPLDKRIHDILEKKKELIDGSVELSKVTT